ncbi:alpha/beta hydrolase [uncultured Legionella sp.]|uniref:alpha/beta hydrolase n=1 Tax=uncultured Legionella sp. TaxID=210934 RepID=UPI0026111B59|nr:alpha/beta hydrolase [uncultured Legionella sp.]
MAKKKIMVLTPDTPDPSYIESVISPLSFLEDEYTIHPIDSLSIMDDVSKTDYYRLWEKKLRSDLPHYDAFFGFSFGGVILQQCFSLFNDLNKPVVLFSTPSCADSTLANKLEEVIALCTRNQVDQALHTLYQYVYYPNEIPLQPAHSFNHEHAAKRVIYGLARVLETDSTPILKTNTNKHLHLIGEQSHLVNKDNVIKPNTGTLLKVPEAGMRMLRDNPQYCQKAIREALNA